MSEPGRIRRPIPARTKPIRTWDGAIGSSQAKAGRLAESAPRHPEDVLARSVEVGYRVVDEYLTRGQEAAQRLRRGAYGASDAAQDVQSVAEQLVRAASDFAGAWVEFFALAGRDLKPASPAPTASTVVPHPSPSEAEAPDASVAEPPLLRVRLRVETVRPVDTTLELRPVPATHALAVHRMRSSDGLHRIEAVRVEPSPDGGVVIRVTVPEDQPAGRYTGTVVDDTTNVPVGDVTIGID